MAPALVQPVLSGGSTEHRSHGSSMRPPPAPPEHSTVLSGGVGQWDAAGAVGMPPTPLLGTRALAGDKNNACASSLLPAPAPCLPPAQHRPPWHGHVTDGAWRNGRGMEGLGVWGPYSAAGDTLGWHLGVAEHRAGAGELPGPSPRPRSYRTG